MNRPYQTMVLKPSFKDEVIGLRQKYLADQEEQLQKELASYELFIKEATLKGETSFKIDLPEKDLGHHFLWWFPFLKGESILRFNKLVELGFNPEIVDFGGDYGYHRYLKIELV